MAHVFRAIWVDDSLNLDRVVPDEFSNWLRSRGTPLGITEGRVSGNDERNVTFVTSNHSDGRAVQLALREIIEGGKGRWMTTVTGLTLNDSNVLWVDMHADIQGVWNRSISAPRVVRGLLLAGGEPFLGIDELEATPREIVDEESVEALLERLKSEYRWIPYLICIGGDGPLRSLTIQRATRAAEILSGVANVYVVSSDVLSYFNDELRSEPKLRELDSVLVLPGWGQDLQQSTQLMYIDGDELGDETRTLGLIATRRMGALSRWVTPEESWAIAKHEIDGVRRRVQTGAPATRLARKVEAPPEVSDENEGNSSLQDQLLDALVAAEELREDVDHYRDKLVALLSSGDTTVVRKLTIRDTISEVQRLSRFVEIPKSALCEIDLLDSLELSPVWARGLANLFASMESYGKARAAGKFRGGYYAWCETTGDYPTTKVSPESEPTMNDPKLRAARTFAVSSEVDKSGLKVMQMHAKIQRKGGGQIPRVFFFDDTSGATGKIHIGFVGPHYLVPHSGF